MANTKRDGGREAYWRGVLRRQAASGQSVRGFCRLERLSEPSFYAWRRTLREREALIATIKEEAAAQLEAT